MITEKQHKEAKQIEEKYENKWSVGRKVKILKNIPLTGTTFFKKGQIVTLTEIYSNNWWGTDAGEVIHKLEAELIKETE